MIKIFFLVLPLFLFLTDFAQAGNGSFDDQLDAFFAPIANAFSSVIFYSIDITDTISLPWIIIWLMLAGVVSTVYLGFPNIRYFKYGYRFVTGKYDDKKERPPGHISHFQALTAAISGTVGLGNIAGVAVAITIGGPGAVFWMTVAGFLGMATKSAECTLGVKYRKVLGDGRINGGPMHYIPIAFSKMGIGRAGKWVAAFFAVACILGGIGAGGMFQSNQAFAQLIAITGGNDSALVGYGWIFGSLLGLGIAWIVIGGIQSVVRVTSMIIPVMVGVYFLLAIFFILFNITEVPSAFGKILSGAFSSTSMAGGILGAIIQGVRRAAFSNEAGLGSAPIAHATVTTDKPVTEGFVALLEPFIDTVIVCNLTALVIIISGVPLNQGIGGVEITSSAFSSLFYWAPWVLFFVVLMFSISTALTWAFYCDQAWRYLTGKTKTAGFIIFYAIMVAVGSSMTLKNLIGFSDGAFFAMAIPNLIAVYFLLPEVKKDMASFHLNIINKEKGVPRK